MIRYAFAFVISNNWKSPFFFCIVGSYQRCGSKKSSTRTQASPVFMRVHKRIIRKSSPALMTIYKQILRQSSPVSMNIHKQILRQSSPALVKIYKQIVRQSSRVLIRIYSQILRSISYIAIMLSFRLYWMSLWHAEDFFFSMHKTYTSTNALAWFLLSQQLNLVSNRNLAPSCSAWAKTQNNKQKLLILYSNKGW